METSHISWCILHASKICKSKSSRRGIENIPASIRIIKIVKDPYTEAEAYTVEFECETEKAKDLLKELTSSPYGQRIIELLNEAKFLPEVTVKTQDELKTEAKAEEREREAHEEKLKERGRKQSMTKMLAKLRELYGDEFVKAFENALNRKDSDIEPTIIRIDDNRNPE